MVSENQIRVAELLRSFIDQNLRYISTQCLRDYENVLRVECFHLQGNRLFSLIFSKKIDCIQLESFYKDMCK